MTNDDVNDCWLSVVLVLYDTSTRYETEKFATREKRRLVFFLFFFCFCETVRNEASHHFLPNTRLFRCSFILPSVSPQRIDRYYFVQIHPCMDLIQRRASISR